MHKFIFLRLRMLQQNYWFWPSMMSFAAFALGILLPYLDSRLGADWIEALGFIRPTQVPGARAILTTIAGATLGVAGVAFSVTIVAVSFASSNYGPRLIGNFMGDRQNQIVLGIFVATFVYCITVLSTVNAGTESADTTIEAFVPQLSVFFALFLTLAAVGALITYIHHIPESINIMNLTARIGAKLQRSVTKMLDEEDGRGGAGQESVDVAPWRDGPRAGDEVIVRAKGAGFLQQVDLESLSTLARKKDIEIVLHRAPGDFLVADEVVLSARPRTQSGADLEDRLRDCYTQGDSRTDFQDILFLSDQLVEVLGRALSTGVNDPQTAILCLNWLRVGLDAFVRRSPVQPSRRGDPVLYRRVTFEDMLTQSFDQMRQYLAGDRTATLHALGILEDLALAAAHEGMADACVLQLDRLAHSATELLGESAARAEIEAEVKRALSAIASRRCAV